MDVRSSTTIKHTLRCTHTHRHVHCIAYINRFRCTYIGAFRTTTIDIRIRTLTYKQTTPRYIEMWKRANKETGSRAFRTRESRKWCPTTSRIYRVRNNHLLIFKIAHKTAILGFQWTRLRFFSTIFVVVVVV